MGYTEQRGAILAHAKTAALAANAKFTNVAVGAPIPKGKCVRIFYAGEAEPEHMGPDPRTLNSRMVAPTIGLVAFWPLGTMSDATVEATDDEVFAFVHALRTAVLADSQLGGQSTDLEMGFADPSIVVIEGTRYATVEILFTLDFIDYPLGA